MIVLAWLCLALGVMTLLLNRKQNPLQFLNSNSSTVSQHQAQAFDLKRFGKQPLSVRVKTRVKNLFDTLGNKALVKVIALFVVSVVLTIGLHNYLEEVPLVLLFLLILGSSILLSFFALKLIRRKAFEAAFPDALNLMAGAISSGESLMQAIVFVGNSLDNLVGHEFKQIGQRLSLGQPAEEVLEKSCLHFPYPSFVFFVITLRANINRGGQLKDIITGLSQTIFNNQALEKKKKAMTAEARMSARIVASIPALFLIFMKYMSPDDFHFVMHTPDGRMIFYYVLVSELLGIGTIWLLMRRVGGQT